MLVVKTNKRTFPLAAVFRQVGHRDGAAAPPRTFMRSLHPVKTRGQLSLGSVRPVRCGSAAFRRSIRPPRRATEEQTLAQFYEHQIHERRCRQIDEVASRQWCEAEWTGERTERQQTAGRHND